MYALDDTIVAISTPIGQGGIGIVRLSGPEALAIAGRIFRPSDAQWAQGTEPNRLTYGHIVPPSGGQPLDEVLLAAMPAPHSYTRQDVVEINSHGGLVAQQEILSLCLAEGARLAHEGEFTLRAFVNGRLDLAQAEAVLDVIQAKTAASLRVALDQLGGQLSQRVRRTRASLLRALAYLVATIDFGEDDIPPEDVRPDLQRATSELDELLREADRGLIYRQGVRVAIVGRPNVGKSSLLNALLRSDRAIVTPVPGTTRDTLEETINLQGIPLVLVDTAGIGQTEDAIERLGVARSQRSVERADVVLLLVDGSAAPSKADGAVAELCAHKAALVLVNKSDLPVVGDYAELLPRTRHLALSALTGEGLPQVEAALLDLICGGGVTLSDAPVASNPRHRELLRRAQCHVNEALAGLDAGVCYDMVSIDLTEAVEALGQITGETASDDLLATIFGSFCIGK